MKTGFYYRRFHFFSQNILHTAHCTQQSQCTHAHPLLEAQNLAATAMTSLRLVSSNMLLIGATITAAVSLSTWLWVSTATRPICKRPSFLADDSDSDNHDGECPLPESLKRELEKERRRQAKIPLLAMKKPMYDNILMVDPQGTLLCTISKKKARWYVNKELGVWADLEETKLQLLFEPSHRSNERHKNSKNSEKGDVDEFFNKSIKENVCVVCGHDQYHMRHYVVPYTCRSLFPAKYKMHMAHDVVILCPDCHLDCKRMATHRMKYLEQTHRKDLATAIPTIVDRQLHKVKSCATALLRHRHKLPAEKIYDYENLLRNHFQLNLHEVLTKGILKKAAELETSQPNPVYVPASEVIVAAMCQDEAGIESFVKGWRMHFLETMEPQYLPKGWSVNSSVDCQSAECKFTTKC